VRIGVVSRWEGGEEVWRGSLRTRRVGIGQRSGSATRGIKRVVGRRDDKRKEEQGRLKRGKTKMEGWES